MLLSRGLTVLIRHVRALREQAIAPLIEVHADTFTQEAEALEVISARSVEELVLANEAIILLLVSMYHSPSSSLPTDRALR